MNIKDLDSYFRSIMAIDEMGGTDMSMNGLQVGKFSAQVRKAAFAVDACMETFRRAAEAGADVLCVHHGLFWGKPLAVTEEHYERLRFLMEHGLALYASHLPLDMQPDFGNNAGIARQIGLENISPFGDYHGISIGLKGELPKPLSLDAVLEGLGLSRNSALGVLPFGPDTVKRVAVISGGADKEVGQAIEEKMDLFITGELSHQVYHTCQEGKIHLIAGGHYTTETYGPSLLAEKCAADTGIETEFIDVPTGL
ncbi:MAG: Nif3-like dinuclear metal center hexameric protein [Sediminispirochaetaceae bacterium]